VTSQFAAPFRRINTARRPYYVDANKRRIPGVTTIIDQGTPKKALLDWGPRVTAEYAIDHWDELTLMALSDRLDKLKGARWETVDAAAKAGTKVHLIAEQLVKGETVDIPDVIAGHVESYVRFLDEWDPQPVHVEMPVCSYTHGYVGIFDLIADFPSRGTRALCDVKTARSGIWGETALQMAAYRYADVILGEGPVPEVDEVLGIHVTSEEVRLLPVTAGQDQLRQFLYVQQVARFCEESRDLIGPPIDPPSRVQRRRLEIVTKLEEAS
jgi:hypothetical protein